MKKIIFISVPIFVILIFCTWFYFTPHITANNMRKAAEANDPVALSSYINFPTLRENLKTDLNNILLDEIKTNNKYWGMFKNAMVPAFINSMVDMLITPKSLTLMMKGTTLDIKTGYKATDDSNSSENKIVYINTGYETFNKFGVSVKEKGEGNRIFTFLLYREGFFKWKLSAIQLPSRKVITQ